MVRRSHVLTFGLGLALGAAFSARPALAHLPALTCPPGDTVTISRHQVAVTDPDTHLTLVASHLRRDAGGGMPPTAGHAFYVVHILIHNGGKAVQSYNELDFVLHGRRNAVNYRSGALDTNVSIGLLGSGRLGPGQNVAGDLVFEAIPAQTYSLQWTPTWVHAPIIVPINP